MLEVNRSLMVVKPKQPFLDWARSLDGDNEGLELKHVQDDCTVYLTPEYELLDEQTDILAWCCEYVFEEELYSWYTDQDVWPHQRNLKMFLEWFEVEFHSLVFDLADDLPLDRIDYGSEPDEASSNGDPTTNGH